MKKWVILGERTYEVDTSKENIHFVELDRGINLAFIDGKPIVFRVKAYGNSGEIETPLIHAEFKTFKSLPKDFSEEKTAMVQQIKSPMPALVVEVNKNVGDRVQRGETVITIEAMKMRTQLKAKIEGVVKHVYVSKGVNVGKGQLLAVIERE
ncbi:MAG: acetyl-CoA carboxylase biotin carboxyl carrier protein subunit [candidate division WOR-3 bacterium]